MHKLIQIRRSVRNFNSAEIEKEKLLELVRAGMQAPSAGNQKPWMFVIIRDKDTLVKLSNTARGASPLLNASAAIVILNKLENLKYPDFAHQDLSACTQNILLEAVNQNIGAVWIGIAPIEERIKFVKKTLNLNDNTSPFSIVALGYTDENSYHFVDRFDEKNIIWI